MESKRDDGEGMNCGEHGPVGLAYWCPECIKRAVNRVYREAFESLSEENRQYMKKLVHEASEEE